MAYESVDQLQKLLVDKVFHYAKDSKKAAGRALGTLVEIITFYLLKSWGFEHSISIERALAEYGNPEITHNVEYSLHPIRRQQRLTFPHKLPVNTTRMLQHIDEKSFSLLDFTKAARILLTSGGVLRNSCVLANGKSSHLVATLDSIENDYVKIKVVEQYWKPYAIFECKRVGVEEGMKKGPQSIEKAKQGAYVAKSLSSLHKLRTASGELRGLAGGALNSGHFLKRESDYELPNSTDKKSKIHSGWPTLCASCKAWGFFSPHLPFERYTSTTLFFLTFYKICATLRLLFAGGRTGSVLLSLFDNGCGLYLQPA